MQDEDFEEDEGIYDDLNLDEEEEKFGLAPDDGESDDSDEASEGTQDLSRKGYTYVGIDIPPRTPKKHDEESVSSSKRDDSPILKKAAATLQMRSAS